MTAKSADTWANKPSSPKLWCSYDIVDYVAAISHLDKMKTWGKQIRVTLSKHQTVQLPKEGQPDAGLTKDYSNSPLHRFKKPGSKNYQVCTLV